MTPHCAMNPSHDFVEIPELTEEELSRFTGKTIVRDSGCIEWIGTIGSTGYGTFKCRRKNLPSHRVAMAIKNGQSPTNYVLHTCDNRRCVNSDHLYEGTMAKNIQDRTERRRSAYGIKNGSVIYPERLVRGVDVNTAKITEHDVREIRSTYCKEKPKQRDLGARFGITQGVVSKIIRGEIWKHVKS